MEYHVETMDSCLIAYVRRVGPYGPANSEVMESLKRWADQNKLLGTGTIFGIAQDNPQTTPPEQCRYDACITVEDVDALQGMEEQNIQLAQLPGGEYMICEIVHTAEHMQQAWGLTFKEIERQGWQLDERPILERYRGEVVMKHYCELCIPILEGEV